MIYLEPLARHDGVAAQVVPLLDIGDGGVMAGRNLAQAVTPLHGVCRVGGAAARRCHAGIAAVRAYLLDLDGIEEDAVLIGIDGVLDIDEGAGEAIGKLYDAHLALAGHDVFDIFGIELAHHIHTDAHALRNLAEMEILVDVESIHLGRSVYV